MLSFGENGVTINRHGEGDGARERERVQMVKSTHSQTREREKYLAHRKILGKPMQEFIFQYPMFLIILPSIH